MQNIVTRTNEGSYVVTCAHCTRETIALPYHRVAAAKATKLGHTIACIREEELAEERAEMSYMI